MKFLFILLFIYIGIAGVMYFWQRKLLYAPDTNISAPEAYGLAGMEEVWLTGEDGTRLHLWFHSAAEGRPTILYFHGNAGHMGYRSGIYGEMIRRGYGLLALSYRGYGSSGGSPSEAGLYADAEAAFHYLTDTRGVPTGQVILYGESLGTSVALEIARRKTLRAVALQAPFISIKQRATEMYRWLPISLLLKDTYGSIDKVADLTTPLLVLVAGEDTLVPPLHSRTLYERVTGMKHLHTFPGINHGGFEPEPVMDELEVFLGRL